MDLDVKETGLRLKGGAGADQLHGSGFRDILYGLDGDDVLSGDRAADELIGGLGNDRLLGGTGQNVLRGDGGNDTIEGGVGDDRLEGGTGADLLRGGEDNDDLLGGSENDRLYGDEGDDRLVGEAGLDRLSGGDGNDDLDGGDGADTLIEAFGADTLFGGTGNDLLISRSDSGEPNIAAVPGRAKTYAGVVMPPADDTLTGGDGTDTFRFEATVNARFAVAEQFAGADGTVDWSSLVAGADGIHDHWVEGFGNDTITGFSRSQGDRIEIAGHTVAVKSIEYVGGDTVIRLWSLAEVGPSAHDGDMLGTITVVGQQLTAADLHVDSASVFGAYATLGEASFPTGLAAEPDATGFRLVGGAAANTLSGSGLKDDLSGLGGNDTLSGDRGSDQLSGGLGNDTLLGGAGRDVLLGAEGDDLAEGEAGDDRLEGGTGADQLHGGEDNDTLLAGTGNDKLCGNEGDDRIYGEVGVDGLWGGDGNDLLDGGDGSDTLVDTFGADTLRGGAGNDVLLSRSDDGEPEVAIPNPKLSVKLADGSLFQPKVFDAEMPPSDDILTGGAGADTFRFEAFINARFGIAQQFADADGKVDWMRLAMTANQAHYHWVDSIGNDTITDFNRGEGDRIEIASHTMRLKSIEYVGGDSIIHLWSQTTAKRAAHNGDLLGTITVLGEHVTEADLLIDNTPFYGAYEHLEEGPFLADDCGVLPYGGHDAMLGHDAVM